jgi:hypothetical protein
MAMKARAIDARFNVLEEVVLPDELVSWLLDEAGSSGLVRHIDEYGDTYFNSLQVRDFLAEIEAMHPLVADPVIANSLSELSRLARLAIERPHRFLVFEGD